LLTPQMMNVEKEGLRRQQAENVNI